MAFRRRYNRDTPFGGKMRKPVTPIHVILLAGVLCLSDRLECQVRPDAYQQAMGLVQQGQFDRAIPLIESILSQNTSDLKARNLLGIALSSAGRREEANEHFRKALALDPAFLPALKNLAVNELALRQYETAGSHFRDALKAAPNDPLLHFGMAEVSHAEGRHAEAAAEYERSGELYRKDPAATLRYARSCMESNQPAAALAALGRIDPGADPQTHFQAGVLLGRLEKYTEAAAQFLLAQSGYPDPYEAGYNLTLAYVRANDSARAIAAGEKLIAAGHRKPELYNLLSQAYENAGRTKDAYDALRKATELDPRDEANYVDLMTLCLKHENFDLSLEISEVALKSIPRSSRLRMERGVAMAMMGWYEQADGEFMAASLAKSDDPLPYAALALVRIQMNRIAEAIELLRKRRQENSHDYLSGWLLAEAISRSGVEPGSAAEKEAVESLENAIRVNPKATAARTLLGKFLTKRGEIDAAAAAFEAALQADPEDTNAAYQLAVLCRKRGDTKRAEELFAKVSSAKSEDKERFTQQTLVKIVREGSGR